MIDTKTQETLRQKYNPEGSDLRRAQLRMVEMLLFLDRVCHENNITYWLDSGTLLGAARHGGFIPWDDDTDVCMPQKDAERFKKIMLESNPSNEFVLQCHKTDKGFLGAWYVLRDLKSEYIQDSLLHKRRKYRGLQIDIFIVEDKCNALFYRFAGRYQYNLIDKFLFRIKNNVIAKIITLPNYYFLHGILKPLFRLLSTQNDCVRLNYGSLFKTRHKKYIYPLAKIMFEGYEFSCPSDYNNYLKDVYGEWGKLPEKIQTHKVEVIFFE